MKPKNCFLSYILIARGKHPIDIIRIRDGNTRVSRLEDSGHARLKLTLSTASTSKSGLVREPLFPKLLFSTSKEQVVLFA